jgi:P pilus assembly chaperone PapD
MHRTIRPAAALGLAALLAFRPGHAGAEGFSVRPILIESAGGGVSVVTLANEGDTKIYIEASALDWSADRNGNPSMRQAGGDVVVSPPAAWIPPGTAYQFRVMLPPPPQGGEKAYRIELARIPSREELTSGHVVFALTQSIPAFSTSPAAAPPALTARADGSSSIEFRNDGGRRLRVADAAQNGRILQKGLLGYVLGHSTLHVRLKAPAAPGQITVETDLGPRRVDVR